MLKLALGLPVSLVAVMTLSACSAAATATSGSQGASPASTARSEATQAVTPSAAPTSTPAVTPSPRPAGPDIRLVKQDTEFVRLSGTGDVLWAPAVITFKLTLQNDGDVAAQATCDFTVSDDGSALADSPFVHTEHRTSTLKPVIQPDQPLNVTYTFDGAPVKLLGREVSWAYHAACEAAK